MAFLVPQPMPRQTTRKQSSAQSVDNRCIFDKIRNLCRLPKPSVQPLDERLFISSIFDDIRDLCRRPELLTGIEDHLIEENETIEEKPYIKRDIKSKYYSDSENKTTFEEIRQNVVFGRVMKRKQTNNCEVDSKSDNICETKAKVSEKAKKRTKSSAVKCEIKRRSPLKPMLTIDLDIESKIEKIKEILAKQEQTPIKKPRTRHPKSSKGSVIDSLSSTSESNPSPLTDSGYLSIASPSVSISTSISYSNPATPLSSSDGYFSQSSVTSCETTSSVMSQIRQRVNPKYETYGQHIQKRIENDLKQKLRKTNQKTVDYKKKVLEWKNKMCSGNSTPVHNMQYSETPPPSPQITVTDNSNDDFTALFNDIENDILIDTNENINCEFTAILSDLYAHTMDM